jgi:hypothetical protein
LCRRELFDGAGLMGEDRLKVGNENIKDFRHLYKVVQNYLEKLEKATVQKSSPPIVTLAIAPAKRGATKKAQAPPVNKPEENKRTYNTRRTSKQQQTS